MNWRTASQEVGKQLLNIAVAGLVFALLQPLVQQELTLELIAVAALWYFLFTLAGTLFVAIGGKDGR